MQRLAVDHGEHQSVRDSQLIALGAAEVAQKPGDAAAQQILLNRDRDLRSDRPRVGHKVQGCGEAWGDTTLSAATRRATARRCVPSRVP